MADVGRRSFWQSPWHFCARCDTKTHISDMDWQRGKLLCKIRRCWDEMLLGDREQVIAQVLSDGQEEFAPVMKLREPDITTTNDDDIFF